MKRQYLLIHKTAAGYLVTVTTTTKIGMGVTVLTSTALVFWADSFPGEGFCVNIVGRSKNNIGYLKWLNSLADNNMES